MLAHRQVTLLTLGHTAREWQSWGLPPDLSSRLPQPQTRFWPSLQSGGERQEIANEQEHALQDEISEEGGWGMRAWVGGE